jgi:hypothetical protein
VIDAKRSGKEIGCRSDHLPIGLTVRFGYESSERRRKKEEEKKTIEVEQTRRPEHGSQIPSETRLDELLEIIKSGEKTLDSETLSEALGNFFDDDAVWHISVLWQRVEDKLDGDTISRRDPARILIYDEHEFEVPIGGARFPHQCFG